MSNRKRTARTFEVHECSSSDEDEGGQPYYHAHSEFKSNLKGVTETVKRISTKGLGETRLPKKKRGKDGKKNRSLQTSDSNFPVDFVQDDSSTPPFVFGSYNDLPVDRAYVTHLEETGNHEKLKRIKPKGDDVLRQWVLECDLFIKELISWEGRGHWARDICPGCEKGSALYECLDCRDRVLWCQECIVAAHSKWFLHRIRMWNGEFFVKVTLKELGLRKQLGEPGHRCSQKKPMTQSGFTVIDVTGIHEVSVDFCGCGEGEQRHIVQLLRAGLFPASIQNPQTAATFDVLDEFELLTYTSQLSGFEFYQALVRRTCNTGLNPPRDRYLVFLRMTHEWRHLHLAMRTGRGHDPMGVAVTQEGSMALLCPACPHPGINMPDEWQSSSKPYVHNLFIAIDANFRLKRKNISDPLDPGLVKGGAYFVEETKYQAHLAAREKDKEPKSSCSRHDAVNLSSSKGYHGHAASGVGKVCCARHDMHLPNSIGDLQVGERYANMDYLFHKAISVLAKPASYVVSYDIACQWSIHLQKRMMAMDAEFFLYTPDHHVQFLVPKFHLPAHISACRRRFSFNYRKGVGRTEGEAPERGWPVTNALAGSTREMLAGTRRDVLNYQLGDYNWLKITNLAAQLRRKLTTAAIDMAEHTIEYADLSSTIPEAELEVWIAEFDQWEANPDDHPYPFEPELEDGPSLSSVRLELAEAEERDLKAGKDSSLHDEVSASVFIDIGIIIENKQRSVHLEVSEIWEHAQDRQKTKALLNTNALQREIDNWLEYQKLYCPGAERERERVFDNHQTELKSYEYPLLLPSALKEKIPVDQQLVDFEIQFRKGQAHEALARLRSELQIRYHIWWVKDRNTRGQAAGTRAGKILDAVNTRIKAAGAEYRVAYAALLALGANEPWMEKLKPLEKGDMRHISEMGEGETVGTKLVSWIWRAGPAGSSREAVPNTENTTSPDPMEVSVGSQSSTAQEATGAPTDKTHPSENPPPTAEDLKRRLICAPSYLPRLTLPTDVKYEWGKCRARMSRFEEEVDLVTAEMDRTKRYHRYYSAEWTERAMVDGGWKCKDTTLAEGLRAYALKKAKLFSDLEQNCATAWVSLPDHVSRMRRIAKDPSLASPGAFLKSTSSKARAKATRKAGLTSNNENGDEGQDGEDDDTMDVDKE